MSSTRGTEWALLGGNFAIGCGVMVVAGCLNDLVRSLQISVPAGGQLITVAAVTMCFGAPLLAAAVGGWDRRRLLTLSLLWFGVGHALSALASDLSALILLRAVTVLGAAVFTPQAAAAVGAMVPPGQRGRAITFVFLGWSVSSVVGMPLHSYVGEAFGWRWAFALVALFSFGAAFAVWRAMPGGIRPAAVSLTSWRTILTHPVLMGIVLVTALSGAGQFTVFSYFAPYFAQELHASAAQISLIFLWFGLFGLIGNVIISRRIDKTGPASAVFGMLAAVALSLALWPLATSVSMMVVIIVPWALGCFSSNSAQQARASMANPAFAPAMMALNSSAIYLGQAAGAASGGALVASSGYAALSWVGLGWMLLAMALSLWVAKKMKGHGDV